ncbi:mobile mystery protein A [Mesorhizobium sp. B2-3-3]|uniref:mobile mystery protein A n=1 Tax=unclassified Mesorhizobium TaxID=325217 RepID=UPI00112977DF|nr:MULTISPECIES: mobile mystery protein A [unclassified Mesorhizobium]TPK60656.1 mobile mystery protein A [Mesorhizobium sp. B2-4-15]TPM25341.1 mobile mystery protein A [Mesorhizobium sp. B2-3-5]TPN05827.1 mobile mystery protein A [Mesorhizobium sp. B2-3-3]
MSDEQARLARKNLDRRLSPLRAAPIVTPSRGWTKAIREALGMTTRQLAERMGVAPSRVTTIEKAEALGAITLKTLRETAEALDCQFVYAFVPTKALDDILHDQAERKVRNELAHLNHTMRLENQAVNAEDLEGQKRRIVADYLSHFSRKLWDKE